MKIAKGSWYMILSSLCFAFIGLFVKLLSHIANLEINFFKSIFAMIISIMVLSRRNVPLQGNQLSFLLWRGIAGGIGIILFFMTLQNLPLATANILQNTSPIFTAILGIFMLNQRVSLYKWLFFMISFLGVGLTHVTHFDSNDALSYSLLIGLISAFMMGLSNNLTAKMGDTEHPLVIFNYSTLCVILISGAYIVWDGFVLPQPKDWLILVTLGCLSYGAHYLAIQAYQLAPVAQVSAISYLGIPYALLIDLLVFGERFQWTNLLGMVLVMLGVGLSLRYS